MRDCTIVKDNGEGSANVHCSKLGLGFLCHLPFYQSLSPEGFFMRWASVLSILNFCGGNDMLKCLHKYPPKSRHTGFTVPDIAKIKIKQTI